MKNLKKKFQFRIHLKSKHLLVIMTFFCVSAIIATLASGITAAPFQEAAGMIIVPFEKSISSIGLWLTEVNKNFKDKRHESEREAVPDGVMEFLGDGDSPRPALAPFTSHSTLKPCKVTLNDAFIHAVLRIQIRKPLGVALACAGAGSQFSCLCLNIAHGHIVH